SRFEGKLHLTGHPDVKTVFYADERGLTLLPGDRVSTSVQCNLADTLFGEEVSYYTARGVFLTAFTRGELDVTSPETVPLSCRPAYWAKSLRETVGAVFPPDVAGVVTAVVTGNREGLSDPFSVALSRSGLSHAVAVSGMHISFLAGFLMLLCGKRRRLGALLCFPTILLFMVVAGTTPSVVRSTMMQLILLSAPLIGRESDNYTSLSAALLLLLLQNPYSVASIGLQLSFAAVYGILLLSPMVQRYLSEKLLRPADKSRHRRCIDGVLRFFISSFAASIGAIVFTTPLTAHYFGTVSLIAPLANLLTLWSVSVIFVGGLLAAVGGFFALPLGAFLGACIAPVPRFFQWAVTFFGGLPFAAISSESLYYLLWLLALYAVILLLIFFRRVRRMAMGAGALCLTLLAAILFTWFSGATQNLTLTALDVGQGQSILLRSRGRAALVDCGGSLADNAGDIAADYLQSTGTNALDYLVLTHYHADHANGVPELLSRLDVATLVLPDTAPEDPLRQEILALAAEEGAEVRYITDTTALTLGASTLRIFPPMGDGGANEEGLSLVATSGSFDALITGDMNTYVEDKLVKYQHLPDCEVLLAGHHGSKHATSQALLTAATPETVIISVGYN
ncbi:MAG: ComEC/Rec2 family competence protein, partial [Oscillospiraceae bacterium]